MIDRFLNLFRSFDEDGYDTRGYDRRGFNRDGMHRNGTKFDRRGIDIDGFDREGFNKDGRDREGFNRKGYDLEGYDREGYDLEGFGRDGFNRKGRDREGFNRKGYDREGYGRDGFNRKGRDREGFNRKGRDREGYGRDGFDREGYDRKGRNRSGVVWWQSKWGTVPNRLLEEVVEFPEHPLDHDRVRRNPLSALGFNELPTAREVQKRAKEMERLVLVGVEPSAPESLPHVIPCTDPLSIKEAAETLLNPKKAREAVFYCLSFDSSEELEAVPASLVCEGKLRAAYRVLASERPNTGKWVRLRFLLALLIYECEGTAEASRALISSWDALMNKTDLVEAYGMRAEQLSTDLAELCCDVAAETGDWSSASAFGRAFGSYGRRYYDGCVTPLIDAARKERESFEASRPAEAWLSRASSRGKALEEARRAVTKVLDAAHKIKSDSRIPDGYPARIEVIDGIVASVRGLVLDIMHTRDGADVRACRVATALLEKALPYAQSVSTKHQIEKDIDDIRVIQHRDSLLDSALQCMEKEDFASAVRHLEQAQREAQSYEERVQLGMLIATATKRMRLQKFDACLKAANLQGAINMLDAMIADEFDEGERTQMIILRDKLSGRSRW